METMTISDRIISNSSTEIVKGIKLALKTIDEKISKTDWVRPESDVVDDKLLNLTITNLALNQRKKIKNKFNACIHRTTICSMNKFLRALNKIIFAKLSYVSKSDKEQKIQEARKKYVEARNIAIKLYSEYKNEKGDYYKNK
jgi:flagellar biosynthesis chaperone FliJ